MKDELTFDFQEIPLDEAKAVVAAGDGKYSDLKAAILDKLPKLLPDKAFAFGLHKGQNMDERSRRGLALAVNNSLRKADIPWLLKYSNQRKLFICLPRDVRSKTARDAKPIGEPKKISRYADPSHDEEIKSLWETGKYTVKDIVRKTGSTYSHVDYLCYTKWPRSGWSQSKKGTGENR